MYPRLSDLIKDLFGIDLPIPIYSFGFMVAVAIMLAAWIAQRELDRLYAAGRISGVRIPVPAEKGGRKHRSQTQLVSPSVLMGTATVITVVGGFAGAKLFHILENFGDFMLAPGRMLFSSGGFTFYGGMITAGLGIAWYVRRKGVSVPMFADALAPALMLAYGVGRIGCHLAGDGDWGIPADLAARPGWIPGFLWAETYPNNILGYDLSGAPVHPTPLYEFMMAAVLFLVLFSLRNHRFRPGWLFGAYLVLNGVERFLIEKIRVNNTAVYFGIESTQAELISVLIMVVGVVILWRTWKRVPAAAAGSTGPSAPHAESAKAGESGGGEA